MHPDSYYLPGSSISSSCHSKKPRSEPDRAGKYGAPGTDCDSPLSLVNVTLDWIEKEWADKIDFVISAGLLRRDWHDIDSNIPRTPAEIRDMNRQIARQMDMLFTPRGVPVVPSIGNNDIWPHNIMYEGPSAITNDFLETWRSFVPFPAYQVFQRGVYFSTELVPNRLAAISLNTLYWYESNKAVDGCPKKGNDPGTLELARGPAEDVPVSKNAGACLNRDMRSGVLSLHFAGMVNRPCGPNSCQDTILGHLYGHKNVDHFVLLSVNDVLSPLPSMRITGRKKELQIAESLRSECKELARKKKLDCDDYFVVNIGPSVIPEYTPSVRIFTYNVTDAGSSSINGNEDDSLDLREMNAPKIDCSKKENKNKKQCVFKKPRHASKHSPSRTNKLWSPTGYSQFFISPSNWAKANASHAPEYELEYVTYSLETLRSNSSLVPEHLLPPELRAGSIESASNSRYAPFALNDLTIPSWIKFARRMGRKKKLWRRFEEAMFLETRIDTD
ncbi:PPN1-vacuolar endopolyphosphatase-like protein [Ceratobasidium sp. AG-Ba]|nr:PPN1-vacuolar endopolyphosphatase-like protein [Ceratobasidium sp. AG-Ba]